MLFYLQMGLVLRMQLLARDKDGRVVIGLIDDKIWVLTVAEDVDMTLIVLLEMNRIWETFTVCLF